MRRTLLVAAMVIAVAGCKKKEAAPARRGMPAGMASALKGAPGAATLKGKVLERLDASVYSYLRLQTAAGETWAAVPQTNTAVGAVVEVVNPQPMDGFESKTLNKKFDQIVFGSLPGQADAKAAGGFHSTGMMKGGPKGPMGEEEAPLEDPKALAERHALMAAGPTEVKPIEVPRATGADARSVAEVWANRAALKEKTVTVRAQVVKVTSGVMGRSWLHVRDGSGTPEKRDNDLTVTTTAAAPAVGDVVVVSGKVSTDRDFGAGYAYPVIVEDATVAK